MTRVRSYTSSIDVFLYSNSVSREYFMPELRIGGLKKDFCGILIGLFLGASKFVDYAFNILTKAM